MKLLIDIPEHIYEHAKGMTEDSRDEGEAMRAIANGSRQESRLEIPNTCGDAISRQAVLDGIASISKAKANSDAQRILMGRVKFYTEQLPSVTPQRRTGRWIEKEGYDGDIYYECSSCGESWVSIEGTPKTNGMKYCPNCGARMEVEE